MAETNKPATTTDGDPARDTGSAQTPLSAETPLSVLELFSLAGSTAVVTGARTGIGQAIAIGLAQAGADVVLLGHHQPATQTAEAVEQAGQRAFLREIDLGDPDSVPAFAETLLADHTIDIVVNNAGIIRRAPAEDHTIDDWSAVIDVNLTSAFRLTQALARPMLERGDGSIINIASLLSFQGGINVVGYASAKHGIVGMTKALANEWGARGVRVNAIAPGYIATNNTQPLRADPDRARAILERIPQQRWGQPHDLAAAAVFLASKAAAYVNGHVLTVDGGWMSR